MNSSEKIKPKAIPVIEIYPENQSIFLRGGAEERLSFLDQLDIDNETIREEIDRITRIITEGIEDQDYYKHLWYRLLIAAKIMKYGQVDYNELCDSITKQVGNIDEDIFDEVWLEIKERAKNLK